MTAASSRRDARQHKLLVVDEHGRVSHRQRAWLCAWLRPGDLVIANDAATLPAVLTGTHARSAEPIEVRLAGRRSLDTSDVRAFSAVVFGRGDHRTPTERRPPPPALVDGDELMLGPLRATVVGAIQYERLVELRFEHPPSVVWSGIASHGRPIQYAHVPDPLAIWDTWTSIASLPVAFEAPSAGFLLDWSLVRAIRKRGARFATITHAAGLSSTGDDRLDSLLPFDEPYVIPASTAALIADTRDRGGRIVAIGTTVVRALEHAADPDGHVTAGAGLAANRIDQHTPLRVVDAIVSGMHESGTSHFTLLGAFHTSPVLERMLAQAESGGYQGHEFGDATFVQRGRERPRNPGAREARRTAPELSSGLTLIRANEEICDEDSRDTGNRGRHDVDDGRQRRRGGDAELGARGGEGHRGTGKVLPGRVRNAGSESAADAGRA